MRALEGGTEVVDAQAALGQTSRAREDELGQERASSAWNDDAVARVFHRDVVAGHRCLLFFFFLRFRLVFFTWPKGCPARTREWLSARSFWVYRAPKGASLLQAAKKETTCFFLGLL